jgi:hypothetical protein
MHIKSQQTDILLPHFQDRSQITVNLGKMNPQRYPKKKKKKICYGQSPYVQSSVMLVLSVTVYGHEQIHPSVLRNQLALCLLLHEA